MRTPPRLLPLAALSLGAALLHPSPARAATSARAALRAAAADLAVATARTAGVLDVEGHGCPVEARAKHRALLADVTTLAIAAGARPGAVSPDVAAGYSPRAALALSDALRAQGDPCGEAAWLAELAESVERLACIDDPRTVTTERVTRQVDERVQRCTARAALRSERALLGHELAHVVQQQRATRAALDAADALVDSLGDAATERASDSPLGAFSAAAVDNRDALRAAVEALQRAAAYLDAVQGALDKSALDGVVLSARAATLSREADALEALLAGAAADAGCDPAASTDACVGSLLAKSPALHPDVLADRFASLLGSALQSGGRFGDTPGLNGGDMVSKMMAMNMQFLALQEATQMESRRFQTLSNASRGHHDTAKNSVGNIR